LPGELELRVAIDELVALDDRGQVALVGDVEEDRETAVDEDDGVELPDREHIQGKGDRDRQEADCAAQVAPDEDRAASKPVDPDAGRQAENHDRQEFDGREEPELEG
jgi:hypothetical protein